MEAAMHALGWGLQRLAIVLAIVIAVPVIAYILWVVVIVVGQGAAAFGQ